MTDGRRSSHAARIPVYLEMGEKRTFAGAIEWPGWCRSGRDEASALQALVDYGPRYQRAVQFAALAFKPPKGLSELEMIERLKGNSTTDFGAPGTPPRADETAVDAAALRRYESLMRACWRTFDAAVAVARGKQLRTGPRGGGRALKKIIDHVREAEAAYIGRLGWWELLGKGSSAARHDLQQLRAEALQALAASVKGEILAVGPRGGKHWSARYFVRRSAWHVLDHAWEIEDRIVADVD